MSSGASDEEMAEHVRDDMQPHDREDSGGEENDGECGYHYSPPSPRTHSEETEEDDDDELHIAARAGIRLLEENMHFREEVLRLHEQLIHLTDEKAAVEQSLADRDTQVTALSNHLREAILENQSILSELSQAKDHRRASQEQLASLQLQLQQRSPRRRSNQRLSPRKSANYSLPLVFEDADVANPHAGDAAPSSPSPSATQSPIATSLAVTTASGISPSKPSLSTTAPDDDATIERRLSFDEGLTSPRRRPTLARLREIEAKYDEEHQRCGSLKLELNFAQRRVSELKPLQSQLEHVCHELETASNRLVEQEALMVQSAKERNEEQELIQSLHQTIHVYEQLHDPRQRGASIDHDRRTLTNAPQQGGAITAETVKNNTTTNNRKQQFERLDRAAEMIDGRFNLREENERLLQQLKTLTESVLSLTSAAIESDNDNAASTERRVTVTKQRYLEQQVSVLQELLQRFRLEWQHAHDARVCLEHEKNKLLQQIESERATYKRTRGASVSSSSSRRPSIVESPLDPASPAATPNGDGFQTTVNPTKPEKEEAEEEEEEETAHARRLWEHTNALCAALLTPSLSSPSLSRDDEIDNELLCFALLRRLVDSWTTDKPQRMQLHDWLTNAIRGTGVRRPLYLHELTSEIAMGFQTLLIPILHHKFGVEVTVKKRLRNVIVTDLQIHVTPSKKEDVEEEKEEGPSAARVQRVYHSLLSVINGENTDAYHDWLGNYSARRASRRFLSK